MELQNYNVMFSQKYSHCGLHWIGEGLKKYFEIKILRANELPSVPLGPLDPGHFTYIKQCVGPCVRP